MLHRRFLVVINKWVRITYLDSNACLPKRILLSLLRSSRSQFPAILADEHLHKQKREKTSVKSTNNNYVSVRKDTICINQSLNKCKWNHKSSHLSLLTKSRVRYNRCPDAESFPRGSSQHIFQAFTFETNLPSQKGSLSHTRQQAYDLSQAQSNPHTTHQGLQRAALKCTKNSSIKVYMFPTI